jgi:hypothetical protein
MQTDVPRLCACVLRLFLHFRSDACPGCSEILITINGAVVGCFCRYICMLTCAWEFKWHTCECIWKTPVVAPPPQWQKLDKIQSEEHWKQNSAEDKRRPWTPSTPALLSANALLPRVHHWVSLDSFFCLAIP